MRTSKGGPSPGFALYCQSKAEQMKKAGLGRINGPTVAYLLYKNVAKTDATWSMAAVDQFYRLKDLTDAELAALDPEPHHRTQGTPRSG